MNKLIYQPFPLLEMSMQKDTYQTVPVLHFSETIKKFHTKKRLLCLVIGNFGAYNLADEAILAGELIELAKVPNLKITVAAEHPSEIRRLHGSVRTVPLSAVSKEAKKADFVISGGGGIFKPKYIPLLAILLWKQRVFKKKIYMFSLCLKPNMHFMVKSLAYPLIKGAALVTAGDQRTAELLKNKNTHVHVFKDQSLFMEPATVTTVMQDPYFKRFYKKNRINIGLALRKPSNRKDEKRLLNELVTFIAKNHEQADFWFYATDHHPKGFSDEKFGHVLHETIKKKIGKQVQFHFIPTLWNPQTYFSSIKLMNFLIAMCPYTALFGTRNNTNIVNIIDSKYGGSFIQSLGKDTFKIPDLTAKKLQTRLLQ